MAYGDSEAEEMDAALMQERITKWAAKETDEDECNKPLRGEIERLQRKNTELATAIQTNNEYLVKTEDEWEARCDALEAKLSAAEAAINAALGRDGCRCDASVCNWCKTDGWVCVSPDTVKQLRATLDAAKTEARP